MAFLSAWGGGAGSAGAQVGGFQLNRYEPTPAAEAFFSVERPWYSSTRWWAAGLTLDYGHNPLLFGPRANDNSFSSTQSVVAHALVGHVDLAGSFLDRVQVSASLPVTLLERGTTAGGISPVDGVVVGDPRLGVMVRLWNRADTDYFSLHVGGYFWIPIGADGQHQGDRAVRVLPKLVLGGIGLDHIRWSFTAGYLFRSTATLNGMVDAVGSTAGPELQLGAGVAWVSTDRTVHAGPELVMATVSSDGKENRLFDRAFTSVEALVGADYLVKNLIQVGAAIGGGLLKEPGTPDLRVLLRITYAPVRPHDKDSDGILDEVDACPEVAGVTSRDPRNHGCPDRDGDGVLDTVDVCPDEPRGDLPDPDRPGCPLHDRDHDGFADDIDQCFDVPAGKFPDAVRRGCPADRDHDGVIDEQDRCIAVPAGRLPDAKKPGCPIDTDGDGVADENDRCVTVPAGRFPDAARPGCPADRDGDGMIDEQDRCPDVPMGARPDVEKPGCPGADRDGDTIPDALDACPDTPGAPDANPRKNGCPGLVLIRNGMIQILNPVFFAPDRDVILPRSFPVLAAVAAALKLEPGIRKVAIEGHTDVQGRRDHNLDLSRRRAQSVMIYLMDVGKVGAQRLEARGFGPDRPIADNKTNLGRARNRRVEFHIVDPPPEKP